MTVGTSADRRYSRELWQLARNWLEDKEVDSRSIRAAVILMACATRCGPNIQRIRRETGLPLSDIQRVSYYMRRAKLWGRDTWHALWMDESTPETTATVVFTMHVLVATGDVLADGPADEWKIRTVGDEFGVPCSVIWRDLIPVPPLQRRKQETDQPVPWWARDGA